MSPLFGDYQESYYLSAVGKLRWAVDLGITDINLEIAILSCYLAQPWSSNLDKKFTFSHILNHTTGVTPS